MDLIIDLFDLLLVDPMTNVLIALAYVFSGNFGVAIIVFTLIMKFVTWPLPASQYKASKAMQEIQPKVQELQKKYKGKDPKKLNQEMMALYREHGVNPLGCLLPMLVQMPIWIALYQVIRVTLGETPESLVTLSQRIYPIGFVQAAIPLENHFLYWNLGQPDTSLVLPFLVAATMYIQQKMITPAPSQTLNKQQLQQQQTQQMMTWMLPLMFGFWSLNVPSGLALYWFISNLSGLVLQYFYMGRTVNWRNLLTFGPPSQAPAARGANRPQPKRAAEPEPEPEFDDEPEETTDESTGAVTVTTPQHVRRKRHGRRRGKR